MQEIYNYDPLHYYTGSSYAQESPLEPGKYLMPARSTTVPPPAVGQYQIPKWTGSAWAIHSDYRGKWYDVDTQQSISVWEPGEPQPTNTTDVPPPPNKPTWVFTGTAWERTLEVAKAEKRREIAGAYETAISTIRTYGAHDYEVTADFITLLGALISVQSGLIDLYDLDHNTYKVNNNEAKDLRDYLMLERLSDVLRRENKYKQINDATDIPTVDSISW